MVKINFIYKNDSNGKESNDQIEFPVLAGRGWGNWYHRKGDIKDYESEEEACKAVCRFFNETRLNPNGATRSFVCLGTLEERNDQATPK